MWLAFVRGIHWWPVNSLHKGPEMEKMFPFDDVIMKYCNMWIGQYAFLPIIWKVTDVKKIHIFMFVYVV